MTFQLHLAAAAAAAALCALPASAADREMLTGAAASPQQIQQFLFPEAECESAQYQCLAVRPSTERSVGMDVKFHTGSSELTPEARGQLEALGKALASRNGKLNAGEIVIEGHTDARGAADLNKKLSERRAESVAKYLVSAYGVDSKALRPVGRGKDDLKDPSRPDSEANRRVELVRKPN